MHFCSVEGKSEGLLLECNVSMKKPGVKMTQVEAISTTADRDRHSRLLSASRNFARMLRVIQVGAKRYR